MCRKLKGHKKNCSGINCFALKGEKEVKAKKIALAIQQTGLLTELCTRGSNRTQNCLRILYIMQHTLCSREGWAAAQNK